MNPAYINPILQLLIALIGQYPQIASSIREIADHKGEWTPAEATMFLNRMEAAFSSPPWQPEVTP